MKLKKEFISYNVGEMSMLIPSGAADWSGLVRGNKTLGIILSLLSHETDEDAVVAAMERQCDAPPGAIASDVRRAVEGLREIGALDE